MASRRGGWQRAGDVRCSVRRARRAGLTHGQCTSLVLDVTGEAQRGEAGGGPSALGGIDRKALLEGGRPLGEAQRRGGHQTAGRCLHLLLPGLAVGGAQGQ